MGKEMQLDMQSEETKEYCHEKTWRRTKWFPVPFTLFALFLLYKLITVRVPKEGWEVWWWSAGILIIVPLWLWLWFIFDVSHWARRIRLTRQGFSTWDVYDREKKYTWDDVKWIEQNKWGVVIILKKRMYKHKSYIDIVNYFLNYDDFVCTLHLYAPQLEWHPAKIRWL